MDSSNNDLVFATAFSQFNSSDIGQNYLGDVREEMPNFFEFRVEGDAEFYFIGQQILDIDAEMNGFGCVFSIQVGFNEVCEEISPPV